MARFLAPFASPYKTTIALLGVLILTEAALNFSFPLVTQYLIDEGLIKKEWRALLNSLVFMGVAAIAVSAVALLSDYVYTRLFADITKDIRQKLFDHVQSMSMPFFHTTPTGTVLSRFSGDLVALEAALVAFVPGFIMPLMEVIYASILMFMFDIWLGLIASLIFPMILWWPRIFARKAFLFAYDKRQTEGNLITPAQANLRPQPVGHRQIEEQVIHIAGGHQIPLKGIVGGCERVVRLTGDEKSRRGRVWRNRLGHRPAHQRRHQRQQDSDQQPHTTLHDFPQNITTNDELRTMNVLHSQFVIRN